MKPALTRLAIEAGAQKVGFAAAEPVSAQAWQRFSHWLADGNNAGMEWLTNWPELRRNPLLLLDSPKETSTQAATPPARGTVIVCAFSYYHPEAQMPGAAQIAMYAHGSDYHEVLRSRLAPLAEHLRQRGYRARICIDSAPVMERYWAQQAGVGFTGRNGLTIVPGMGSWFFLAEIITDAVLEPDPPCTLTCGDCGRCVKTCPGGALRASGGFDSRRCLSYLTIEHRGELPDTLPETSASGATRLVEALGNRVYGCDECQRHCPHNANPPHTAIAAFNLRPALRTLTHAEILAMTPERFSAIFTHSAVKRAKLAGLRRNASLRR